MNRLTRAVLTWHRARRIRKRLIPRELRGEFQRYRRRREVPNLTPAPCTLDPESGVRTFTSNVHNLGLIHMEWEGEPVLYERPLTTCDWVGVQLIDRKGHIHATQVRRLP